MVAANLTQCYFNGLYFGCVGASINDLSS